jgi:glycosyltransferase involved in cell wall biosynthesis
VDEGLALEWFDGFGPWERGDSRFRWSDDDAEIRLWAAAGETKDVTISFGKDRPVPATVEVVYEGTVVAAVDVGPGQGGSVRFKVTGRPRGEPICLQVRCEGFRPVDYGLSNDTRSLGVQITDLRVGSGWRRTTNTRLSPPDQKDSRRWLNSYDQLLVTSTYVQRWVKKRWSRDAEVLYPAVVPLDPADAKDKVILSVGRFFPPERGHSKRQLEMVEAFRRLVHDGRLEGWELHLVGGCQPEDRSYLDSVADAASGLPVRLHVDLPGLLLADLYSRASLYWHATGLYVKRSNPEAHEHFGISVVEAMSAGAVPVVFRAAGPLETVRDSIDGFHFGSVDELVDRTRRLVEDPALLARMSSAARARAATFDPDVLQANVRAIVAKLQQGRSVL